MYLYHWQAKEQKKVKECKQGHCPAQGQADSSREEHSDVCDGVAQAKRGFADVATIPTHQGSTSSSSQ
jgi:hypothetical protein